MCRDVDENSGDELQLEIGPQLHQLSLMGEGDVQNGGFVDETLRFQRHSASDRQYCDEIYVQHVPALSTRARRSTPADPARSELATQLGQLHVSMGLPEARSSAAEDSMSEGVHALSLDHNHTPLTTPFASLAIHNTASHSVSSVGQLQQQQLEHQQAQQAQQGQATTRHAGQQEGRARVHKTVRFQQSFAVQLRAALDESIEEVASMRVRRVRRP